MAAYFRAVPIRWASLPIGSGRAALGRVDWERGRLTIRSPKTEHHEGKESRVVPLFPEILAELERVAAEVNLGLDTPVNAPVIRRYRKTNANLRTQLEPIIRDAGLEPWRVLFNSLRSTRDIELRDQFP